MPDVTFGAVSLQLRTLVAAGLVDCEAKRQQRFYRARRAAFGSLGRELERMWGDALWRLKLQAELEASRRGPRPTGRRRPRERAERGSSNPASERVGGTAGTKPAGLSRRKRES
jgi:hypothetical protein